MGPDSASQTAASPADAEHCIYAQWSRATRQRVQQTCSKAALRAFGEYVNQAEGTSM